MNRLDSIENTQLKDNIPAFQSGDNVRVHVRIQEGNKERLQVFEGVVHRPQTRRLARNRHGSQGELRCRRGKNFPASRNRH